MTVLLSLAARQARLLGLRGVIDGGAMRFYANTPPAKPEDPPSQTLLASVQLADPAGSIGAIGPLALLAFNVPIVDLVSTTGLVGWVRLVDHTGAGIMDLPVGLASGDYSTTPAPPVLLSETQLYAGGEIRLVSCNLAE